RSVEPSAELDRERALARARPADEEGGGAHRRRRRRSVVDAALGRDAGVVGVLALAHLGDRVGDLDELVGCVAAGDDDVDLRRTATFQPRATPRIIVPSAAVLLPLPLPVLTRPSESTWRRPPGRGSSTGGSWVSPAVAAASVIAGA